MPKIKFIEHNGTEHLVDAEAGKSIMLNAVDNLVPGIDADCGGECSCATCHIIVEDNWAGKAGSPSESENSMLDMNPDRAGNSRLSCQIPMTEDLDGIVIHLPEFQY